MGSGTGGHTAGAAGHSVAVSPAGSGLDAYLGGMTLGRLLRMSGELCMASVVGPSLCAHVSWSGRLAVEGWSCCGVGQGQAQVAGTERSHEDSRAVACQQAARKQGSQPHNHKKLSPANHLGECGREP